MSKVKKFDDHSNPVNESHDENKYEVFIEETDLDNLNEKAWIESKIRQHKNSRELISSQVFYPPNKIKLILTFQKLS